MFALLFELIHTKILPTKIEEKAVQRVVETRLTIAAEEASAVAIQRWWRYWSTSENNPDEWQRLLRSLRSAQRELRRCLRALMLFRHQTGSEVESSDLSPAEEAELKTQMQLARLTRKIEGLCKEMKASQSNSDFDFATGMPDAHEMQPVIN